MAKLTLSSTLLLCVCAVGICHGLFWSGPFGCKPFMSSPEVKRCFPCQLFKTRTVTLVVRNSLRDPNFEETIDLTCTRSKTLFYMMLEAADTNEVFRFSANYFGSDLGFFIESINGVTANFTLDKTWWAILNETDSLIDKGVSSYEPRDGETLTFNFTQSTGH